MPVSITDPNDNIYTVTLDALGRVLTTRFKGTESGRAAGYSDADFTAPVTAEDAVALNAQLPVSHCFVYVADSWEQGMGTGLPPHVVQLVTDRYDGDTEQKIRQQVVFCDGFGRLIQTSVRQADGEAWQRSDDGALILHSNQPASEHTTFRWAISGRTEYDNKGQPVRSYQPFFLNDWKYISDDSARQDLYADTHYYDPIGRVWQVKSAKGWLRRVLFTPWFVVSEDENDTIS